MNYQIDICEKHAGEPNAPVGIRKKYERIGHGIMKKIRVLMLLLVVLLLPCLMFIACGDDEDAANCNEGHTWRFEDKPHKQTLIASVTCTTPEIRERECKVCGYTEQYESKEPTGHRYNSSKKIYLNDATCEENGHYVLHCYKYDICGHTADKIEEAVGTATGHTFLHYIPTVDDPTVGVAKCVDCDKTNTMLLGIKADMEGDRSHLSYDAIMVNTAKVESAKDYTGYKTVGDNTYLAVTRPELGTYLGGSRFGVVVSPNTYALENTTYIFEAVLFLNQNADLPSCDVQIVGKKALLNQTLPFVTYNSANGTIDGIAGAVYGLTADDYANGVKISLLINDKEQWYQIYVNDALVSKNEADGSGTITYGSYEYYAGIDLGGFEIIAAGDVATEFGVDDIRVYAGSAPDGYEGGLNQSYTTVALATGEQVSIKLPTEGCAHNYIGGNPVLPGCVTAGYTVFTCTECGGQEIRDEVEPNNHTFDISPVVYEADCFNAGYTVSECSVCHAKVAAQTAPKLEHVHGDDAVYTASTCEEDAVTKGDCALCGTYFEVVHEKTALGHELGEGATVTNPTCTTDGYTSGYCKHCGEEYTDENSIVKAFGHYSLTYTETSATCGAAGCKTFICASCGVEQVKETEAVSGHKLFTKVEENGGRKYVTNACVNCEYSFTFEAVNTPPKYSEIKDKLTYSYYQDDKATSDKLNSDGGDYTKNETINGFKNQVQWVNGPDNKYATFIGGTGGGDGYFNFPANDLGIKDNTVWEFDIKFPDDGMGDDKTPQYKEIGLSLSFSTNAGNVGGNIMKIYRDGSIVGNNFADGYSGHGAMTESGNKTTWDVPIAEAGTVNKENWTRIAIALDMTNKQYSVYVNGSLMRTIDLPKDFGPALRYIRMMVIHNDKSKVVGAVLFRNMYYYKGDVPLYMTAPSEPVDVFNTSFLNDTDVNKFDDNGFLTDLKGDLKVYNKENFKATVTGGSLVINAGPGVGSASDADTSAFDSYIEGPLSAFDGTTYTVKANVKFDKTTGEYDIIKLVRANGTVSESLVYIKDGKLNALGGYSYTVGEGEELEIIAIVNDLNATYDLYVNGVVRAKNISFADGDFAKTPGAGTSMLRMFSIRNNDANMGVTVSDIDVYDQNVSSIKDYNIAGASKVTETSNFGTATEPNNVEYVVSMDNGFVIEDKASFRASALANGLGLVYDKANVKTHFGADDEAYDSAIALNLADYKNLTFVAKLTFTPNATTGGYDVLGMDRDAKKQSLVYVEDGKLKAFGSDYELPLVAGEDVEIEIVINNEKKGDTFTLYVNGELAVAKSSYKNTEVGGTSGVDSILRMFRVTNADEVMDVSFKSFEIYTVAEGTDEYGTAFSVPAGSNVFFDGTEDIVQDLNGGLDVITKQSFTATLQYSKLYLKYVPEGESVEGAAEGFDSHVFGDVTALSGTYTVNIDAILVNVNGKYDVFKLIGDGVALDVITVTDNTITTYGGWTRTFNANETVTFDIIVKGGKLSVYVGGILVVENVTLPAEYTSFKMFNVTDATKRMEVTLNDVNVYDKEVIPSYYVGKLANPTAPGRIDNALSFDGTENPLNFVPANSKIAGGFYYEEISGSYLLAVAPADIKPMANTNLVKISTKDGKAADDGVWTLNVGDFATNGVYPLTFMLEGMVGDINNGYDISDYSRVSVSFFVDDKTAGYEFEIKLVGDTALTVFSGTKSTGWYTVELDLTSAPDYVYGITVDFKGVDGKAEVDGFNFYLYNVDFACDSRVMEELIYVYKPAAKAECETKSTANPTGQHTWETVEGTTTVKVVTVPATCDTVGYTYKVCTKCSYVEIVFENAKGHTFDKVIEDQTGVGVLPGCEYDGAEAYACSCEGCTATTIKPLYKTEHKFEKLQNATEADGYIAPTCEADGYDVYVCTNEGCSHEGKKFLLKTSKTGHAKADDATEAVISELGCESDGIVEISKCANCGESYQIVTEAIGHDYKEVTEAPDCVNAGKKYDKCANCGDVINEVALDALGHTAPAKYLLIPVPETCTNAGGWKYTCTVCGEDGYIADDEDGLPHPHTWGDWTVVTDETCGTDGHKDKTCAECGGLISELGTDIEKAECVIPMTGEHVWATEWSYSDDFVAGVSGEKWHDCTEARCFYTKEGDKPEGAGTEGIVFAYNNTNAYVIVGYNGSEADVVIPAIYKGKPVIVGNTAFAGTAITSVQITDGVLISDGAFKNCAALAEVKLPADLAAIPVDAFSGCTALESIELPASCTVIRTGAFYGCTALETVVINGTLTEVQMFAFAECNALTTVKYVTKNIPYMVIAEVGNDKLLAAAWSAIA